LIGGQGKDFLDGGAGDDILTGVNPNVNAPHNFAVNHQKV
jgi:Ca2+-binding RTX toxin-like protein